MPPPDRAVTARQLAALMPSWREVAGVSYLRLAEAIRLLVLDGRIPLHSQLPAERELAATLRVSRTTVSAAYGTLRDTGYLRSRRGARSWTTLPSGDRGAIQTGLAPTSDPRLIDLAHAAMPAPATAIREAVAQATSELTLHLGFHGYDVLGLPDLRAAVAEYYNAAGVPTTPEHILITHGAQHGLALTLRLLVGVGDRVLVEHPTYPNALDGVRRAGGRLVPVAMDAELGWDVEMLEATVRQSAPRLAYLVPDFQNPTGHLMPSPVREQVATLLHHTRTPVVIDETLRDLPIAGTAVPPPFAAFGGVSDQIISLGSTGKSFWGGLRVGWLRASPSVITRLAGIRSSLDLGSPVLEQLVVLFLLRDASSVLEPRQRTIRHGRTTLMRLLGEHLPGLRYRPPDGGLSLWAELEESVSSRLVVAAEQHGLQLAAGPRFGVDGAFERYLRIPFTLEEARLDVAVQRLAAAYYSVLDRNAGAATYDRGLSVA